jgi:hypothetical protein
MKALPEWVSTLLMWARKLKRRSLALHPHPG